MLLQRDDAYNVVFALLTENGLGSGLFIADERGAWLLTASHVARTTKTSTFVVFASKTGQKTQVPLGVFNQPERWIHHKIADISCLPIAHNPMSQMYIKERCFPIDHFNLSETCVSRDIELTSMGFPKGLGLGEKVSPLTFRSYASSSFLTLNRGDTDTLSMFFCMENPSCGGYSGCPVFDIGYVISGYVQTKKEKTVCHGIMHGTISDNTGGKIALVTPAFYLNDIIPTQ